MLKRLGNEFSFFTVFLFRRAKKRKHKHKDKADKGEKKRLVVDEDAQKHGGWWHTTKFEDIIGSVAIEFGKQTYIKCLDNGLFTLGSPHNEGRLQIT